MIVGNPTIFAIESGITKAYDRLSFRALGYFVIHVSGRCYGVKEPDASMLAVSLDEVGRKIDGRGSHESPFPMNADAKDIAHAFRVACYGNWDDGGQFFGMAVRDLDKAINAKRLMWAPDGDEAFDDGSYVLQFEDASRVRLIAFASSHDGLYDPDTLRDVWLSSDDFYEILGQWRDRFKAEWEAHPKSPDGND
jgi:hypothetical protein